MGGVQDLGAAAASLPTTAIIGRSRAGKLWPRDIALYFFFFLAAGP